ncbi:MAG: hypothetical protein MMC23_008233 [Stictis urceolatum]|nr:hypothetical protein [Stictis urceolata]
MGGISMTNHPVTDVPCFFVHPCNTADAMHEIVGNRQVTSLQYLQIWLGLIGAVVGLSLPIELAMEMKNNE